MFKAVSATLLAGAAFAQPNSYARGVPPTTQNCRTPTGNRVAWGLVVDREFGGCRCADEQEQEWAPVRLPVDTRAFDNTADWRCECLNTDTYLSQVGANLDIQEDGKECGVVSECLNAAVQQQRDRWEDEKARARQVKDQARVYAKKSMMPDSELHRARTLRNKHSAENRARARAQVAGLTAKYRAVKDAMLAGNIDKAAFQKAYAQTAANIATYRAQFAARQADIDQSYEMTLSRQRAAEGYVAGDLQRIEEIYEQTLAGLADRYGKRIAYFQSLHIITNATRTNVAGDSGLCPILE